MKKIYTLFIFSSLLISSIFAAPPTVPSSNLTFSGIDGAQFTGNYTMGNGANRIIVIKQGSPVTGLPVNGVDYTANSAFGTANTLFTAVGEYVVAKTSWNSFTVTNLQPGTVYYVAIYEYNGTGTGTQYLSIPLTGNQSTVIAPTQQTFSISTTGNTGNTINLAWSKGNGVGRLVLARKGSAVTANPLNLTNYFADAIFGNGTQVGTANYVVYKGTGTSVAVKNLEPNTTYHFSVFEYNGSSNPMFLVPGAVFSSTTSTGPNVAPSAASFNYIEGNRFTISVTPGNGTRRLFIAKKGSAPTSVPVNGTTYTANAAFGTANTEIAPGEFVVSASTGNSVNVTNLEPNTVYHFRVYEYDADIAGYNYYLTSSYAVKSGSTATTPTTVSSNLHLTALSGSGATVAFTAGNGTYRMAIMKAGAPVDAAPADLAKYTGNASFGSGAQLGSGNYVVQGGMNGSLFIVSNLQPGITYHVALYEYHGNDVPVYSATAATFSFSVPLEPTAAATAPWSTFNEGASFRLVWNNGNGARRIVIAKKSSAVTAKPVDQTNYTANAGFGLGQMIAPGEYVVYDGTSYNFDVTNLEPGNTYHFAIFEYNVSIDGKADYLTTSWLATNAATVPRPTTQTAIGSVSDIQSAKATINFTKGNGTNRLFIMKQGSPVNVTPQDLVKYTYNSNFGTAGSLISDGNYTVMNTAGNTNFTVNTLQPNTTYHVAAFEFNGTSEPVYLQTAAPTISFTTTDAPGATTPTVAASNALTTGIDGNKFTFKWTIGNGEKRIVVMRQGSAVNFVPASGTSYTANAAFGTGTDLGNGQYIVYNGAGSMVDITNLLPSATYYFAVYEFNGTGALIRYLTSSLLVSNASTSLPPTTTATAIATVPANGQLTINWTNGNGSGRIVVMKEEASVTAIPADLGVYPANPVFKTGAQVATGEYVVYAGAGSSVTVTGLESKTYYFRIFEYNGSAAPVYNTTLVASGSATVSSTLPVKLLYFTAKEINGNAQLRWATSSEQNNAYFVIERSRNGSNFEAVANIAGAGNSNSLVEYSYTDALTNVGKIYYRLKQVDIDGKSTYSSVVLINPGTEAGNISLYPNPASDQFRISLPKGIHEGSMSIFDSKGSLTQRQKIVDGQYVNCAGWRNGIYYLIVSSGEKELKATVVKQ